MKVALLSTSALPVPPPAYGGTELVIAALAGALAARGIEVTVYATGDSRPAGRLRYLHERGHWPPDAEAELRHARWAWTEIRRDGPDIVHVNGPEALEAWDGRGPPPVVTIHHQREERLVALYRRQPGVRFVAISKRQARLLPELAPLPVVHHGIDVDEYPAGDGRGGYCAWLGRIAPEKAPHLAIDAARRAGTRLVMGARDGGWPDRTREYFEREVRPRLAMPGVSWPGEMDKAAKRRLLCGAQSLLMPMDWEEPFGLVMIEAMLVGTPVVAFARGSAPEIVDEGVTGFVVGGVEEMARALPAAAALDRDRCRRRARERFNAGRMADEYLAIYRGERPAAADASARAAARPAAAGMPLAPPRA